MAMTQKLPFGLKLRATQKELEANATLALTLTKQASALNEQIDKLKGFFRDAAGGEQLSIPVTGLGTVSVKTPAAAATVTNVLFDQDKFNALDAKSRKFLIDNGVVEFKTVTRPEGTAAVSITPNK